MKRPFRKKSEKKEENTSLVDADYNKKKLFKKGINLMADERLDDAARAFEQVLRIDPDNVEALLKLGYSRFHLEDYSDALKVYDKILDIDVTNAETWNLKALVHYEQKNYSKALDSVEKAIESEPTFGMAWYNKSCFLSLLSQIPESLEALKRSIEIDVKNARKAIKDLDFVNVRAEEGFKRIEEVVVIESIRQGYHTIGSIVWTTFIDKNKALLALDKLLEKGLIVKHETRKGFTKVATYDLVPEMAQKVGVEKKRFLGTKKRLPVALKSLKGLSEAIQAVKSSFEEEDVEKTIENFDPFIDPNKYGQQMIEQFFEEHREIRKNTEKLDYGKLD
jgi:tetratricopeptide (TPR) repeat protein